LDNRNTASPNSSQETEYELSLYETRPAGRNPNDVVLTTKPVFETRTELTQFVYGMAEPMLLEGMTYVWRVRAIDRSGKDAFRNQGYSEVCTFIYDRTVPDVVVGKVADFSAKSEGERRAGMQWKADPAGFDTYAVQYRKVAPKPDGKKWDWFSVEKKGNESEAKVMDLEPDTEYETRLEGRKQGVSGGYSELVTFRTEKPKPAVCGQSVEAFPQADVSKPLDLLLPGMVLQARGLEVTVTQVSASQGGGYFGGQGRVSLPYLAGAAFAVQFQRIYVDMERNVGLGRIEFISRGMDAMVSEQLANQQERRNNRRNRELQLTDQPLTINISQGSVSVDSTGKVVVNDVITPQPQEDTVSIATGREQGDEKTENPSPNTSNVLPNQQPVQSNVGTTNNSSQAGNAGSSSNSPNNPATVKLTGLKAVDDDNTTRTATSGQTLYLIPKILDPSIRMGSRFNYVRYSLVASPDNYKFTKGQIKWQRYIKSSDKFFDIDKDAASIKEVYNEGDNQTTTVEVNGEKQSVDILLVEEDRGKVEVIPFAVNKNFQVITKGIDKISGIISKITGVEVKIESSITTTGQKFNEEEKNTRFYKNIRSGAVNAGLTLKFKEIPLVGLSWKIPKVADIGGYISSSIGFKLGGEIRQDKYPEDKEYKYDKSLIAGSATGSMEIGGKIQLLPGWRNNSDSYGIKYGVDFDVRIYGKSSLTGLVTYDITNNTFKGKIYLDPLVAGAKAVIRAYYGENKTDNPLNVTLLNIDYSVNLSERVNIYP
jgi:hypothetical protein